MKQPRLLYMNYASIEAEFALQLAADLRSAGVAVWLDRLQLSSGAEWNARASQALERAAGMLLILSPDWFTSRYCQTEYAYAVQGGLPIYAVSLRVIGEHEYPAGIHANRIVDFSEWRSELVYRERFRRLMGRLREDQPPWMGRQPDDETRYLIQLVARMEAQQGTLEYVTFSDRQPHATSKLATRQPPALAPLWGSTVKVVALDKMRHAVSAEPRWRRSPATDLKSALARRPRAILLGAPGTGKTAALQRLTLDAARARLADSSLPVPVYINLAHWTDEHDFEQFAVSRVPMLRNVIDMTAEGSAILYIDGLNEITQRAAVRILQIRAWLSSVRAPQRVLFACRARSYDDALDLDLPMLEIEPLDDAAIYQVIAAYVGETKADAAYRKIVAPESTHPMDAQTRSLARVPMLLGGLIFLYKSSPEGALPSTLGGLLKRWMAALWVWKRMTAMPAWMPFKDVEAALAKLAFLIIERNLPTGLPYGDALQLLSDDKLLRAAQNAGLIDVEADVVAFRQPLIAEYFAAVGATRYTTTSALQPPHFNRWGERVATRWDAVLTILAGLLANADDMLSEINSIDPFLAAQVLAGGVEASPEARERTIKLLVEIIQFVTGEGRLAAVRALADLQYPDTLNALLEVLRGGTWQVRQSANWLLHRLPLPLPRSLFEAVREWNWSMDEKVAAVLREEGATALPLLLQVLRDEQWTRRRGAAWALGEIGDVGAAPGLIEALADDESAVRREAALALRMLKDLDSLPMLLDSLRDPDGRVRRAVLDAVVAFKSAAVPGLIDLLRDDSLQLRQTALEALAVIADADAAPYVLPLARDRSPAVRAAALAALGKMKVERAVPLLIEALADEETPPGKQVRVRDVAAAALAMIGTPEAAAALEPRPDTGADAMGLVHKRGSAQDAVERLPGRSRPAPNKPLRLPQLLEALSDNDWRIRKRAVEALADHPTSVKIPALLDALHDDDAQVRYAAVQGLAGASGDAVIWGLIELLRDPEHLVADAAAALLAKAGQPAVAELLNLLIEDDVTLRARAVETLGKIGDPAAVPRLLLLLDDHAMPAMENETISDKVAAALKAIGSDAALEALKVWRPLPRPAHITVTRNPAPLPETDEEELGDTDVMEPVTPEPTPIDENDDLTGRPLADILPYDDDAPLAAMASTDELPLSDEYLPDEPFLIGAVYQQLARMLDQLHAPDWQLRQQAARELRDHTKQLGGLADQRFAERLISALSDAESLVRWSATEALAYIHHPTVPPALAGMLKDSSWTVRVAALRALYEHEASSVADAVAGALNDEHALVREVAAEVLGKHGGEQAIKPLATALLRDKEGFVRRSAAAALGELKAQIAVPILLRALNDEERQVRYAVVDSLGRIGDRAAVEALTRLLRSTEVVKWDERPLCEAAAEALLKIGTPDAKSAVTAWKQHHRKQKRP